MGFWKFSPFLVLSILALYHMGALQAAPLRSASENPRGPPALTDDQICLLLTAMLNDYVGLKVRQLEQDQETEGSRSALENPRGPPALTDDQMCLLLTAMLNDYVRLKVHQLEQDQETEGSSLSAPCGTNRLEGFLASAERMVKNNFVPTAVDPKALGRRPE